MSFVHLHLHSEYSLSDGLLRVGDLAAHAAAVGAPAAALTDVGNLFGAVKFYHAAVKHGVKPIIGCELRLLLDGDAAAPAACVPGAPVVRRGDEDFCSVVALCMNNAGYRNLTQLVTRTYLEGRVYEGPLARREWFEEYGAGLIILSGGVRGDVGRHLLAGNAAKAAAAAQFWKRVFPGRYYLEVYRTEREGENAYFNRVLPLAARARLPLVATNDVCFLEEGDFDAHEVRVCIAQGGYTLKDAARLRRHSRRQYFRSDDEMRELFSPAPEALTNAAEIARRCTVFLEHGDVLLPDSELPPGVTEQRHLTAQAHAGLKRRLGADVLESGEIYARRLAQELDIILRMGYAGYFLIVADFVRWAKEQRIPVGPGRGSGAGSLTAYALGITELDPIEYGLLFERFLNPERVSPPDFDIDFCMDNRDRVIEYVAERYGRDKVCQIITFGRLAARIVVRDVGRVLGNPYGYVDQLAKLIPDDLNITLDEALAKSPELKQQYRVDDKAREILDIGRRLEGLVRNPGTHAGGVIISPQPLTEYTALYCEYKDPTVLTQLDMKDLETIGLVKFDFLGLRTLTVLQRAVDIVKDYTGEDVVLEKLPLDDAEVYRFLQTGATRAVFQLESDGIRSLIKSLKPDRFEDLVALLALHRPGPLQSGMVEDYIKRKHGAAVEYWHPSVEPILRPTYGVILYQEQVMQIARELSGYTLGAADILRRAMGKKLPEEMNKQKNDFVSGAVARGVEHRIAVHIFTLIEHFAGYGFNKAHSTAYALIAYQTAWFKTHHPAAFMAAVLTADMRNTDKVVEMAYECRAMGLAVKPPDVNRSHGGFTVLDDATVVYGLGAVRTVGTAMVQCILDERAAGGEYQSLMDLCVRVIPHKVRKSVIEPLLHAGALDGLGHTRAGMLRRLDAVYSRAEACARDQLAGQDGLFDAAGAGESADAALPAAPGEGLGEAPDGDERERLLHLEKGVLGFYLSEHPVARCERELRCMVGWRLSDEAGIAAFKGPRNQAPMHRLAGVIVGVKRKGQRGRGAVFMLDDGSQRVTFRMYDEDYAEYGAVLAHAGVVVVEGRKLFDVVRETSRWYAKRVLTLDQARLRFAKSLALSLDAATLSAGFSARLKALLEPFVADGRCPVRVRLKTAAGARTELALGEGWRIKPCGELFRRVESLAGVRDVRLIY